MVKRIVPSLAALGAALVLAGCAQDAAVEKHSAVQPVEAYSLDQKFAQAGDGTVIPNFHPDDEAVTFAQHCSGGGSGAIAPGMSECTLIGLKGTPSRVVGGEDQTGHSHDAIWYIENGKRTVYKFDDDRLTTVIK